MIRFFPVAVVVAIVVTSLPATSLAADAVEFLNGTTMQGTILAIRKDAKEFEFRSNVGGQQITRTYPYAKVHAVTLKGKRFVLTPRSDVATGASHLDRDSGEASARTKADVLALIDQAGTTPPDWFESTATNHPASLDLGWPLKAAGPWNASKNVGQYIWERVNPNVARWRPGIKLVHECLAQHQGNRALTTRDMGTLGEMYFTLLQDYPRAAFWFQKANVLVSTPRGVYLAECYWRLGNKPMALAKLRGNTLHFDAIKLFGDMGEIERALKVANQYGRSNQFNEAFLNAGDALRKAGRLDEAMKYYQRVLDLDRARNADYKKRFHARASGAIEAIKLFDQADVTRLADGTYIDKSTGYNGMLEVEVTVVDARIESAKVTKHREKQFYAALTDTPQQIIDKQSIRGIDGTSGATITSQAIVHATARALAQGNR